MSLRPPLPARNVAPAAVAPVVTRHIRQIVTRAGTMRVRLTLWYVALLAVLLVAVNAFLYVSLDRLLQTEVDRLLATQAREVVQTLDVRAEPLTLDPATMAPLAAGVVVAVYGRTGERLIASDGRSPLPALVEEIAAAAEGNQNLRTVPLADGQRWRVLTLPVLQAGADGRPVAVLQVARSEQDVAAALDHLLILMVVAVPTALVLAMAGGLSLAGKALAPIDNITRAAARIGAADLSQRLGRQGGGGGEVGRLAATFDGMLDRLEGAFQRQRQFTADASHELRHPLTLLLSQLDLALERPRSAAEYEQLLRSVREDATGMSQLLGELLTLARADAGSELVEWEPLRLDDLAETIVSALTPLAETRGVALVKGTVEPVSVAGDQTRLTQLVVNLVDNGLKYTPAGGWVEVHVRREAANAVLQVCDSGVGIAATHLPHVFERFYRADPARARATAPAQPAARGPRGGGCPGSGAVSAGESRGAGLGLAIGRWIVKAHGGDISIESDAGQGAEGTHGTVVTVRFPALAVPVDPPARDQPDAPDPDAPDVEAQPTRTAILATATTPADGD